MKIGILGSGIVGRVLGSAFIAEGNEVMLGTRDVQKAEVVKWLAENPAAKAGSFEETAIFGELIVLAASGDIITEVINNIFLCCNECTNTCHGFCKCAEIQIYFILYPKMFCSSGTCFSHGTKSMRIIH